ncbi:MAG: hypothetical protein ACJ752_15170 [Gaiellaceae bacterium]
MAPNSHIPPLVERDLVYRRVGPGPTSPGPEQISAWLDATFKPTQNQNRPQAWVLNLEDTAMTAEALYELIVPLGERLREGRYGESALFVASGSPQVRSMLEGMAVQHNFPLFILDSLKSSLRDATPVGPVTETDRDVLAYTMAAGGIATSAHLARAENITLAAASNRLADSSERGYLAKVERPRKQGNQFLDPRVAFAPRHEAKFVPTAAAGEFDPARPELRDLIAQTAREQGRQPAEVLADMWRAYTSQNYNSEAAEFRKVGEMISFGDREALKRYLRGDDDAEQS